MIFIQAAPDELFFSWQYKVQAANFAEYDLEKDMVILVGLQNGREPSAHIKEFESTFKGKIYYYKDTRKSKSYLSSIRPNLIKQYLKDYPTEVFCFIDQDIIWLEHPHLERFEKDPYIYTAKQAKGYTYAKYMKAFNGGRIYEGMCKIMNVDPGFIESKDEVCGGAQYIIKGTDYRWWEEYEDQLEQVYKFIDKEIAEDRKNKVYNIQHWGADLYAIWMKLCALERPLAHLREIDFAWPYTSFEEAKKEGLILMHNAGISEHNRNEEDIVEEVVDGQKVKKMVQSNRPRYFDKGLFKAVTPFDYDFSFVKSDILQHKYISYFKQFSSKTKPMAPTKPRHKLLVLWNSTYGRAARKIHPELVKASLEHLKRAIEATTEADIIVKATTWEPIPDNPLKFAEVITPFRDMGHLNYLLQLKHQVVVNPQADIVCIIEHDTLTPKNYFNEVVQNWNYGKYGLNNRNYIGINRTGYLDVVERHHPMSMMSFAKFYFAELLNKKIDECMTRIAPGAPFGLCCVEPDDKGEMAEFNSSVPSIHVSGDGLGEYHHNFTTHDIVCYERDSKGKYERPDWGYYLDLLPFLREYMPQPQRPQIA